MTDPHNLFLVQQIKSLYNKIYLPNDADGVSTAHADELDDDDMQALLSATKIPVVTNLLLSSAEGKICLHAMFKHGSIIFAVLKPHRGNSQVYFYPKDDKTVAPIPRVIQYIFTKASQCHIFAVVQHAKPLDSSAANPFSLYPHWPA